MNFGSIDNDGRSLENTAKASLGLAIVPYNADRPRRERDISNCVEGTFAISRIAECHCEQNLAESIDRLHLDP